MGTEILIGVVLGFVILGPRRMHAMLRDLGRAKAQFDKASRDLRSQLAAQLEPTPGLLTPNDPISPDDNAPAVGGV
jgi:Sec-independent protein translocase protein TatA